MIPADARSLKARSNIIASEQSPRIIVETVRTNQLFQMLALKLGGLALVTIMKGYQQDSC